MDSARLIPRDAFHEQQGLARMARTIVALWLPIVVAALPVGRNAACAGDPQAGVQFAESPTAVTIANSEVKLVFGKAEGTLNALAFRGRELLGGGKGYIQVALSTKDKRRGKWEFRVCRREAGLVEIAFADADPRNPFDMAAHYIVRSGEPGFHQYLTLGHDAGRSPGVHALAQYDFCLRADPRLFTHAAVDDQRVRAMPTPEAIRRGQMVMDATYRLADGAYYSKYFYAAEMDERHRVHGVMGRDVGLWIIMPSHEHLNGGPEHQELTVHQTDTTPVQLRHFCAAHYGAGQIVSDAKQGSWSRASATWFVYVNAGRDQAALWHDAKQRAADEAKQWPYAWLDDARFQLRRGSVTGRIVCDDAGPASGARIILAEHEDQPASLYWQQQWRGYRFYGWADAQGRFDIGRVRPGRYDLYAWQSGRFGQFVKQDVRVAPGETDGLGDLTWNTPGRRKTLWQIGVPDRSAAEFGFAEDFRQWGLWDKIAAATLDGVTFVVGRSAVRDWPFQMAVTQNTDLSWRAPVWRVQFNHAAQRHGDAVLTLGIAAFEGKQKSRAAQLQFTLNGAALGEVRDLEESGAAHRSGVHGVYQQREIVFDAARLKPGQNTLVIEMPPGRRVDKPLGYPAAAVMFDCLRLELQERQP
jgi:rhamnogalacturonan endolyase